MTFTGAVAASVLVWKRVQDSTTALNSEIFMGENPACPDLRANVDRGPQMSVSTRGFAYVVLSSLRTVSKRIFPPLRARAERTGGAGRKTEEIVVGKALLSAFLIAGSWCTFSLSQSQSDAYVRENYTKYEYLVPVRDGVKLFTSVYVPKDHSKTHPIMVTRTPYSVAPYGADNFRTSLGPSEPFMRDGFIF